MSAPKGNQFWKLGYQPGAPRIFETPEQLWEKAKEYFEWCDANPLISIEYYGKDAFECQVPKMRAYSWSGLETYLGIDSLRDYKTKYDEFSHIVTHIGKILFTQKFEGAAAGLLNANIIARELGLAEKTENKTENTGELIIKGEKFASKDR